MVGKGEKFVGGVYFVGEGVNRDFLLEGVVSASIPLWSRQRCAVAGQCEGDNHCVDHFYFETLEGISKLETFLFVVCVERKGLAGEYLEPPSGPWRAD